MRLRVETGSLRQTTATEYVVRFLFGGALTVAASLIATRYGPVVGGLFLAFPGIFPAGVSMVEAHKRKREADEGETGTRAARGQASVEAAGASCGALGLAGFAAVLWKGLPGHGLLPVLGAASLVWMAVSGLAWWLRERM